MQRIRTRSRLFAALRAAPVLTALLAAASCSLEGLADPPPGAATPLYEAEQSIWYGGFIVGENENASGGKFVFVPMDADCADGLSMVAFRVNVITAGSYIIRATVSGIDGKHDSFFVSVDKGAPVAFIVPSVGRFVDDTVTDSYAAVPAPLQYTLEAGPHQVFFKCRESGASVDRIWLEPAPP